ncbi:ABC transporter ATP-binding protein, partial [Sneathia sp. DSM 16630]|nr:ABC transporter ATP-binding protein [Sneathia sp. DSM 16630]
NTSMLILILLGVFFKVMAAYKTGEAFNYILSYNFKLFYKLMSISGLYFLLYLLVVYIKIQYQNYITQIMLIDIKLDIINSIEKSDYEKFNENESGTYISWLSNDMLIIEQKGFNNLYQITTMLSESLLSIFGLFFFHWSIIVFTLLLSVTTILLPSIFNNTISKKSIDYSKSLEKFISQNTNVIQGFNTLLSFNRLCNIRKSVKETSDFIKKKSMNLRKIIALSAILGALCNLLS